MKGDLFGDVVSPYNGQASFCNVLAAPNFFDAMSLDEKTVAGPGSASALKWTCACGGGCNALWGMHEEALIGQSVRYAGGGVFSTTSATCMTTAEVAGQPFAPRYDLIFHGDDSSSAQVRPVGCTVITQGGTTSQALNESFDSLARPINVTQSNAPSP